MTEDVFNLSIFESKFDTHVLFTLIYVHFCTQIPRVDIENLPAIVNIMWLETREFAKFRVLAAPVPPFDTSSRLGASVSGNFAARRQIREDRMDTLQHVSLSAFPRVPPEQNPAISGRENGQEYCNCAEFGPTM